MAAQSDLIIFSDGPKNDGSRESVSKTREILRAVQGFKSVELILRNENLGLAKSIILGVTELIARRGKLIVLEDDLITSPYFLQFMNDALDYYQDDERVISVNGYKYPFKGGTEGNYFLRGADCWGWGTWKRGWDLFESDGNKLLSQFKGRKIRNQFDVFGSYPYVKMLHDQIQGKNNSWAIRWQASAFLNGKLTLYPGRSLVNNIGMDNSGTHSLSSSQFDTPMSMQRILIESIPVIENEAMLEELRRYFLSIQPKLATRIRGKLAGLRNKLIRKGFHS